MNLVTKSVLICPPGGLNTLLRSLKCVGLQPVPAPTYRKFALPAVLPSDRPYLFATRMATEPWLDGVPAAVAVGRMPDGRVRAVWVGTAEPSGLHAAVGAEGCLLRRMYAELACVFHVATAVSAVGGGMGGMAVALAPDNSKTLTFSIFLRGDDPTMADGDGMRMPQTIRVTIDPKGKPTVEVVGGQGTSCTLATRQLVNALGVEDQQELKPEYFETTAEDHVTAAGG